MPVRLVPFRCIKMSGKERSGAGKCGFAILGLILWISTAAICVGIIMDTWLYRTKPTIEKHHYFGLWRVCLMSKSEFQLFVPLAPSSSDIYQCRNIFSARFSHQDYARLNAPNLPELQSTWNIDIQMAGLVCMLLAAACIFGSHLFFMCGYVRQCCCRTLGKAFLPAVLLACCSCQIAALVTTVYAHGRLYLGDDITLGWAYYLIAANSLVTFCVGIATIIIPCLS